MSRPQRVKEYKLMHKRKVYQLRDNAYGVDYMTVNGKVLFPAIYYKVAPPSPYQDIRLIDLKWSLAILTDHLGEYPTNQELEKGEGKLWKIHLDFAKEVVKFNWEIMWSDDIQSWIEQYTFRENMIHTLTNAVENLPLPDMWSKMPKRKVYCKTKDTDGSIVLLLNGIYIDVKATDIRYHRRVGDMCDEDMALSILADYFGERPTQEQLDKRKIKCWEFHLDFAREILSNNWEVLFDTQIQAWLDKYTARRSLEQEITRKLESLPVPIRIKKEETDYSWSWFDHRGTSPTFTEALDKALEYSMDTVVKYLEIFSEIPDEQLR